MGVLSTLWSCEWERREAMAGRALIGGQSESFTLLF